MCEIFCFQLPVGIVISKRLAALAEPAADGRARGQPLQAVRVEGTAATISVGITRGADIVRVHDVKEMARVAKMTDAIVR